jgi:hypothetical protein
MELWVTTRATQILKMSDDIDDEPVSASAGVARHQGSLLPKITKWQLPSIDKVTGEETDSSDWVMMVKNSLRPMMLGDLIDATMPRPSEDDPLYRRWDFWSLSVAAWMYLQVEKDVRTRLSGLANRPKYADQLFEELVSYTQGGDRSDNVLIDAFKWYDMKRDHYGSAEEYISDYQRQMNMLRKFKIAPPAFISIGIMILELQDELPDMLFMREALRKVKEPNGITHEDFNKQCKKMTIRARQLAFKANKSHQAWKIPSKPSDLKEFSKSDRTDPAADPSNQNTQNNRGARDRGGRGRRRGNNRAGQRGRGHEDEGSPPGEQDSDKKPPRRRGNPPKGKDIHEYAYERREAYHQRIDGKCSHCGFGPHNAWNCFYLAEYLEDGWHVGPNVWAYSLAIKASEKTTSP